ncbi:MAG: hypothetical protein M1514_00935 [Patescibacteria group bacterium]|nr:hypothetical protein [Patescibacteria group bacterium]
MLNVINRKDEETSEALQKIFYQYTHLPLGQKEIICPYWRDRLSLALVGPYGGKGRPEQIVEATSNEAEKAGVDLNKMSAEEILAFMQRKKIGIDCSGLAFWLLDVLDKERDGNGITDDIPGAKGKFLTRASVEMLTSDEVSREVILKEIKPGDMIKVDEGRHILIVMKVMRDMGKVGEIEYAHSSQRTKIKGVHLGKIKVVNSSATLAEQQWEEEYKFDSLRRLKIWG